MEYQEGFDHCSYVFIHAYKYTVYMYSGIYTVLYG